MERPIRKPFQGVLNIVRFNWHFYVLAFCIIAVLLTISLYLPSTFNWAFYLIIAGIILGTTLSLLASYYSYDVSDLYTLNWLDEIEIAENANLLNISAGFDETSALLAHKYPNANLKALDFYNPQQHTEVSIERARKTYPQFPGTQVINTTNVDMATNSADCIFLILAAHEIRNEQEQIIFFKQLKDTIKIDSKIVVVEHIRDLYNFLAYNIGFFHFFSAKRWLNVFNSAGLTIDQKTKINPFITVYFLN